MDKGRNSFGAFSIRSCYCEKNRCNDIVYKFGNNSEPTSKPEITSNFVYKYNAY